MAYPANLTTLTATHRVVSASGQPLKGYVTATPADRVWAEDGSIVAYDAKVQIAPDGTYEIELPHIDQAAIRNKGVPWRISEYVPGRPRSFWVAPTVAHGTSNVDIATMLTDAPASKQTIIQAGPVTDEAAAELLTLPNGAFRESLSTTIGTETQQRTSALVPGLVDDRIAQQPAVAEAAATRAVLVAADPAIAGTINNRATQAAQAVLVRARPVLVETFGAIGDGATDDSAAIRAAAAASGQVEFSPGKTYVLSREGVHARTVAARTGQVWNGNGATLRLADGSPTYTSIVGVQNVDGVTIRDLNLDGNRANQSVEAQLHRHGVYIDGATNVTLENVNARDTAGDGILVWRATDNVTIRGGHLTGAARNGISLTGSGTRILIDGVYIDDITAQPIDLECDTSGAFENITIIGCYLNPGGNDYGLALQGRTATENLRDLKIVNNYIGGAIIFTHVAGAKITGNTIDGRGSGKDTVKNVFSATDVQVTGNTILADGTNRGVTIDWTSGQAVERWTLRDNDITSADSYGIFVGGADRVRIAGNRVRGNGNAYAGIDLQASRALRSVAVEGNEVTGYKRGVHASRFGTGVFQTLRITGNYADDEIPGMIYGVQLAGTIESFGQVIVDSNTAAAGVTQAVSIPDGVWVRTGGAFRGIWEGTGSPEGVLAAAIGSLALRRNGTAGQVMYVKETGSGATGWVAK